MVELNYVGSLLVEMNGINMEKVETPFYWLAVVIVKVSFPSAPNHFVQDEVIFNGYTTVVVVLISGC